MTATRSIVTAAAAVGKMPKRSDVHSRIGANSVGEPYQWPRGDQDEDDEQQDEGRRQLGRLGEQRSVRPAEQQPFEGFGIEGRDQGKKQEHADRIAAPPGPPQVGKRHAEELAEQHRGGGGADRGRNHARHRQDEQAAQVVQREGRAEARNQMVAAQHLENVDGGARDREERRVAVAEIGGDGCEHASRQADGIVARRHP